MGVGELIISITKGIGLSPACLVALVALYIMYRLSLQKDRIILQKDKVIEKMSESLGANTVAMVEMKTLLTTFLPRR